MVKFSFPDWFFSMLSKLKISVFPPSPVIVPPSEEAMVVFEGIHAFISNSSTVLFPVFLKFILYDISSPGLMGFAVFVEI